MADRRKAPENGIDLPPDEGDVALTSKAEDLLDGRGVQVGSAAGDAWGAERGRTRSNNAPPPPPMLADPVPPPPPALPRTLAKEKPAEVRASGRPGRGAPAKDAKSHTGVILFVLALAAVVFFASQWGASVNESSNGMKRQSGTLIVESDPAGAAVFVDDISTGKVTPVEVSAPLDRPIKVRVEKVGYASKPLESVLSIPSDLPRAVSRFLLLPGQAVSVESNPSEASVRLESTSIRGMTPFKLPVLPAGDSVVLIVEKEGYRDVRIETKVADVKDGLVKVNLERAVVMDVTSSPGGAEVKIDGVTLGQTPIDKAKLPDRPFRLEVKKDGFEVAVRDIKEAVGARLHVDLVPLPLSGLDLPPEVKARVRTLEIDLKKAEKKLSDARARLARAEEFQSRITPDTSEVDIDKADRAAESAKKEVDDLSSAFEKIRGELDDIRASAGRPTE